MKIEIDFEEVEDLKTEIRYLEQKNEELSKKLKSLSEDEIKDSATVLAERMFKCYMNATFKELGFDNYSDNWDASNVIIQSQIREALLKEPYEKGSLEVSLCATITSKFKKAFLHLGINTDEL